MIKYIHIAQDAVKNERKGEKMKKVLAVILAMLMIMVVFAGCGGGGTETSGSGSSNSEVEGSKWPSGYPFNETDFKGKTLTWCTHWAMPDEKGYQKEFMDATGAKLEFNILSGGGGIEYYTQLNAGIASGSGPDIAVVYNWAMPTWIRKGLLLPLDTALDLSDKIYDTAVQGIMDFFNYQGKEYVISDTYVNSYYMVYRKDLIEEAGLEDPYEVWKAGEWSYERFNEYLQALTYDSNDDEIIDKIGLTGYTNEAWFGTAENGNYVRYDENGYPQFALIDDDILETLVQSRLCKDNGWQRYKFLPVDEFMSGNFAFLFSAPWDWPKVIEAFGIENLGWVQLPYAPSNTSKVVMNRINAVGYAFTNNLDVPELAEEWIKYSIFWERTDVDYETIEQELIDENWGGSREFYEFNQLMQTMTFAPNDGCFGVLPNFIQNLVFGAQTDTPANLVQAAYPTCQAEINKIFFEEE